MSGSNLVALALLHFLNSGRYIYVVLQPVVLPFIRNNARLLLVSIVWTFLDRENVWSLR